MGNPVPDISRIFWRTLKLFLGSCITLLLILFDPSVNHFMKVTLSWLVYGEIMFMAAYVLAGIFRSLEMLL